MKLQDFFQRVKSNEDSWHNICETSTFKKRFQSLNSRIKEAMHVQPEALSPLHAVNSKTAHQSQNKLEKPQQDVRVS
jgi:hypothetical protein